MATTPAKHILVAPLDWGLGHTTRCVPLLVHLQRLGHRPLFAGNEAQRSFISSVFPGIATEHLEGYNVTYSGWNRVAQAGLLAQMPRLQKMIAREQAWLWALCSRQHIAGIISDNRYGLFHDTIPSVFITHQLQVRTGMGLPADRMLMKLHYRYINRFSLKWIVDVPGTPNLGGILSHPAILPANTSYIGLLSQFEGLPRDGRDSNSILMLLSGPEPQRTNLSRLLWAQAGQHNGSVIFVEGSTGAGRPAVIPAHIQYHSRAAGAALHALLQQAGVVICRSGYSTIMDLTAQGKKAILIPTPGQTEQEYLAKTLQQQGVFYSASQSAFSLQQALQHARSYSGITWAREDDYSMYRPVLERWLAGL